MWRTAYDDEQKLIKHINQTAARPIDPSPTFGSVSHWAEYLIAQYREETNIYVNPPNSNCIKCRTISWYERHTSSAL